MPIKLAEKSFSGLDESVDCKAPTKLPFELPVPVAVKAIEWDVFNIEDNGVLALCAVIATLDTASSELIKDPFKTVLEVEAEVGGIADVDETGVPVVTARS